MQNKSTHEPISGRFDGEQFYDLTYKTFNIPDDFKYSIITVTAEYIARPDLLSIHLYGTPNYADVICKLNGVGNPFELNEGMYLVCPDPTDIQLFYQVDHTKDIADKNSTDIDVSTLQRKKNESRKANEQVIGDRNFRIDRNSKIVIY